MVVSALLKDTPSYTKSGVAMCGRVGDESAVVARLANPGAVGCVAFGGQQLATRCSAEQCRRKYAAAEGATRRCGRWRVQSAGRSDV